MSLSEVTMSRLPSGRHSLTREAVFQSQRGRLLVAVLQVAGDRGWASTRIADVVQHAGVSRKTFYEHFTNLDACFAEAFEVGVQELLRPFSAPGGESSETDFASNMLPFFEGYAQVLREVPGLAQAIHLEFLRSTDLVLEKRAALFALLASRMHRTYDRNRRMDPSLPAKPAELFALLVGGLDEVVRERLRTLGPEAALSRLEHELQRHTLTALGLSEK